MSSDLPNKVNELLAIEAERGFREDIAQAAQGRPWLNWFNVEEWKIPPADPSTKISPTDPFEFPPVEFTSTVRSYELKRAVVRTGPIDVTQVGRSSSTLQDEIENFRENILLKWEKHLRSTYARLAEHKIVDGVLLPPDQDFPAVVPSQPLNLQSLELVEPHLKTLGVPARSLGMVSLVSDVDTIVPPEAGLIKAFDTHPRRWKIENGEWVEVPAHLWDGPKRRENPEYAIATIQDYPVLVRDVMSLAVPKGIHDREFDRRRWHASTRWVNILDMKTNPDGRNGHFRALLTGAIKPLHTDFAIIIRALRP